MGDLTGFALKPSRLKLNFCILKPDLLWNCAVNFSGFFTRSCALTLYGLWFSWHVMINGRWWKMAPYVWKPGKSISAVLTWPLQRWSLNVMLMLIPKYFFYVGIVSVMALLEWSQCDRFKASLTGNSQGSGARATGPKTLNEIEQWLIFRIQLVAQFGHHRRWEMFMLQNEILG